jgi:hypothetical protein
VKRNDDEAFVLTRMKELHNAIEGLKLSGFKLAYLAPADREVAINRIKIAIVVLYEKLGVMPPPPRGDEPPHSIH